MLTKKDYKEIAIGALLGLAWLSASAFIGVLFYHFSKDNLLIFLKQLL